MKPILLKNWIIPFLIIGAVFIVYGNALFNRFVYDDGYLIVNNDFIKDVRHIRTILTSDVTVTSPLGKASGYYRPMSMLFLMANYHLWGLNPFAFHFVSILIHALNSLLVFFIVCRFFNKRVFAFLCALIFAVHPVHVEAVTPIYNFMGILTSFFALLSFLFFLKSAGLKKMDQMLLSIFFYFLAVFSKEEALLLPVMFVLYDYLFVSAYRMKDILKTRGYLSYGMVGLFYLFIRFLVVERPASLGLWDLNLSFNVLPAGNFFLHLLTVFKIITLYLILLFVPVDLSAFHLIRPISSIFSWESLVVLSIVSILILSFFYFRKKEPRLTFFIGFFFMTSFLVLNIIPIGGLFAERFMYLPSLTFCFIVSFVLKYFFDEYSNPKILQRILILGCVLIVFFLGLQTALRNYVWRTNISLWEDTVSKTPESFVAWVNLADSYFELQRYDEALKAYQASLPFASYKQFYVHNSIGKILGMKGQYDLALREFEQALAFNKNFAETYYNLGITWFNKSDMVQAKSYFTEAMKISENYPWSYYGMGLVLEREGRLIDAMTMFRYAVFLDPNFPLARQALERVKK